MTEKQKCFVDEYLVDLNGRQAAIRAGYSRKNAATIASKNLKSPEIEAAVQKRMAEREKRTRITQDMVLEELARIAFADISDFVKVKSRRAKGSGDEDGGELIYSQAVETDSLSREQTAAIASIKETRYGVCVELYDKSRALNLLGQHLGMFSAKNAESEPEGLSLIEVINAAYAKRKSDDGEDFD